jgi:hypothetical protein
MEYSPIMSNNEAKRIITLSNYEEKQQAVVDAMILQWHDVDAGAYGFQGYETLRKAIANATDEQNIDIANAILDRRADKVLA